MTKFVLDASVSLAWFVDGPVPAYAERTRQLISRGAMCVVPMLWHLEMGNGLAVAVRRGILTRSDSEICLSQIDALLNQALETDSDSLNVRQAFIVAHDYKISAYDAVYLDTARRLRLPLATLDKQLAAAAPGAGAALLV